MRRAFIPLCVLLLALMSVSASADTLRLSVSNGFGDNFVYQGQMNGHPYVLQGGPFGFLFSNRPYMPGSTFGGQTELFLYPATLWVNNAPVHFIFSSAILFITSSTLPTTQEDFTVPVDVGFSATGVSPGQTINLNGAASGTISFYYWNGSFYPEDFEQAPEPNTLALMGTGALGLLGAIRRGLLS